MNEPLQPEEFGFFARKDCQTPGGVLFYEKDHESIDKTKEKNWQRLNLYLSKDGNFINVWYGVIETAFADDAYLEVHGFNWSDHNIDETLFRGYIHYKMEAETILKTIQIKKFSPQYLGRSK